ncbi:thioredoxin family protein [Halomonas koreensis]|uniref:Thioredoxin family protein n=1 Tax=Halomonas koreensis TaxID=245385 RepID=A0ABU1G190_9GAMM|nr:thioredoxin family protein [Halomonas koreensis]MDR5866710.1 thioredoxin family protein [Halomonas koreensis]
MQTLTSPEALAAALADHPAVLVLFGGRHCGVCHALAPPLSAMLAEEFPRLRAFYVDCQGEAAALCAQQRVFSLPVVRLWFAGQPFDERGRVFALGEVREMIRRPYAALFGDGD